MNIKQVKDAQECVTKMWTVSLPFITFCESSEECIYHHNQEGMCQTGR